VLLVELVIERGDLFRQRPEAGGQLVVARRPRRLVAEIELDDDLATVRWIGATANETAPLQPVDGAGHGA
jgi:hypothetical protein